MDFLRTKNVFYKGKEIKKLFYGENIIWSKMKTDFSKDFKTLNEDENFEGIYDINKKRFVI